MLTNHEFEKEIVRKIRLPYLIYTPESYDPEKKFPLLVFLHGAGERGNDLSLIARHGFFKQAAAGTVFPFVMAGPQCPHDRYWGNYLESLNDFLDEIIEVYNIDKTRVYLTGLSMGGTGVWQWLMANPERFAAAAPVCGSGIYWYAGKVAHKPIWMFHGEADTTVLPSESIQMEANLRKNGGNPKLTLFPQVGHNAWDYAYNKTLVDWLMAQKLHD